MGVEGPQSPDVVAVSRRAMALSFFLRRAQFEAMVYDPDVAEAGLVHVAMSKRVTMRLHAEGLWNDVPHQEQRMLARRPGSWSEQEAQECLRRGEYLAALLWSLSLALMPHWDREADVDAQIRAMQPPEGDTREPPSFVLRGRQELANMREAAQTWLARAHTRLIVDLEMEVPSDVDLDQIVAEAAKSAHARGFAGKPVAGDFPALGKAYRDLDDDEFRRLHIIAAQRLRALDWLCTGMDEDVDSAAAYVPTLSSLGERTSTADRPGRGP